MQAKVVAWVKDGKIKLWESVSHRLPMAQYRQGFDLVHDKKALKAVLLP